VSKRATAHHIVNTVRNQLNMSEQELWAAYRMYGGGVSLRDVSAFLRGDMILEKEDIDILALALNERFTGEGLDPSSFASDERPT
jgi:hypothetical protein